MAKKIIKNHIYRSAKSGKFVIEKRTGRQILEEKVKKGTDFAIREYGDVFKKLAEYDRK